MSAFKPNIEKNVWYVRRKEFYLYHVNRSWLYVTTLYHKIISSTIDDQIDHDCVEIFVVSNGKRMDEIKIKINGCTISYSNEGYSFYVIWCVAIILIKLFAIDFLWEQQSIYNIISLISTRIILINDDRNLNSQKI